MIVFSTILFATTSITAVVSTFRIIRVTHNNSLFALHGFTMVGILSLGIALFGIVGESQFTEFRLEVFSRMEIGFSIVSATVALFSVLNYRRPSTQEPPAIHKNRYLGLTAPLLLLLCALALAQTANKQMAEIAAIQGDYEAYYAARVVGITGRETEDFDYLRYFFENSIIPLLSLLLLNLWIRTRRKRYLVEWLISVFLLGFMALLTLQKAPIFVLVLSNLYLFASTYKITARRHFLKYTSFFLLLLGFVYGLYSFLGFEKNVLFEVVSRIVLLPVDAIYSHFFVFPDIHPFTYYGTSYLANIFLAFSHDVSYLSDIVIPYQIAAYYSTGALFNLNVSITGAGWGEYGYMGIFQSSVLVFGTLAVWDRLLRKKFADIDLSPMIAFFFGTLITFLNVNMQVLLFMHSLVLTPAVFLFIALGKRTATRAMSWIFRARTLK